MSYLTSSILQGDIVTNIRKTVVTDSYVDYEIVSFSDKWQSFDIDFEYRLDERNSWIKDAVLSSSDVRFIRGNRLYGFGASTSGETSTFRWEYAQNNLFRGNIPEIKISILPRISVFSQAGDTYSVSKVYGQSFVDLDGFSTYKCIGYNNDGNYMCVTDTSFFIVDSLIATTPLYELTGLSSPTYARQIASGDYIICQSGAAYQYDSTLTTQKISYTSALSDFVYFDYSEENEILLLTDQTGNTVYEISWSLPDNGALLWTYSSTLTLPSCATYKQKDVSVIFIADTGVNNIVRVNRFGDTDSFRRFKINSNDTNVENSIAGFNMPLRVFGFSSGDMCVVEKQGVQLTFDTLASSSSSSSSIDSSSSSSIDSSSSSIDSSSSSSVDSSSSSSVDSSSSSSVDSGSSSSSS